MIKAYHAVGTGRFEDVYEIGLFDRIASQGVIFPAITRVSRSQMRDRCLDLGPNMFGACPRNSRTTYTALRDMTEEVINTLPDDGDPYTKFHCLDIVAGDLDHIFFSVERWFGNIKNGFVFDAEDLLRQGAVVRDHDILDDLYAAIEKVCAKQLTTAAKARRAIGREIRKTIAMHTFRGKEAIELLEECQRDVACRAEVIWTGPLSLDGAVEAWRAGRRIFP